MGKGDRKSRRGKIFRGSYGKARPKTTRGKPTSNLNTIPNTVSKQDSLFKGIVGEAYVNQKAFDTYLKYWCFENPIDIDGDKKEICDLLILFNNVCIIISIKNHNYSGSYEKYKVKVIEKSTRQLYGAERKLFKTKKTIRIKNDQQGIIIFDPSQFNRVHLLTVNVGEQFEQYELIDQDGTKRTVNIINKETLVRLFRELDTVLDLTEYLTKREDLLTSIDTKQINGFESDLLAVYLLDRNSFPSNLMNLSPDSLHSKVVGTWDHYDKENPYVAEKRMYDKNSYFIDRMVENDVLKLSWGEKLAKELFNTNRFNRRILAESLIELITSNQDKEGIEARRAMMIENNVLYLFIYYPKEMQQKDVDRFINDAANIYYIKHDPQPTKVIVLAGTNNLSQWKFALYERTAEMTEEERNYWLSLCEKYKWFVNPVEKEIEFKEFPSSPN